jgi:hypothetical protein
MQPDNSQREHNLILAKHYCMQQLHYAPDSKRLNKIALEHAYPCKPDALHAHVLHHLCITNMATRYHEQRTSTAQHTRNVRTAQTHKRCAGVL